MIQLAGPDDFEALAALAGQLGYPSTASQVSERMAAMPVGEHRVWLARVDGRVLGWIHAYVARHVVIDPLVEIGGLVVSEDARGQGVGPQLLDATYAWARELGCAQVGVHSNVVRADAHRFYEREGFTLEKRQGVFTRRVG